MPPQGERGGGGEGGHPQPYFLKTVRPGPCVLDLLSWTARPILYRMSIQSLVRSRFSFEVMRGLRGDAPIVLVPPELSFTEVHGAVGCTGRTLSRTLKVVVADGSVERVDGRYRLTERGVDVLELWAQLVALDGEPAGDEGANVSLVELEGEPSGEVTW